MIKLFLCFIVFLELLLTFRPPSMMDTTRLLGINLNINKNYFPISISPWFELFFSFLVLFYHSVLLLATTLTIDRLKIEDVDRFPISYILGIATLG